MNEIKNSCMKHCGYCGGENSYIKESDSYICNSCGKESWAQNKTAICLSVPVWNGEEFIGMLFTERAIPPIGALCLVSGFQDYKENYFKTAVREFQEEIFGEYNTDNFILSEKELELDSIGLVEDNTINIICVRSKGIQYKVIENLISNFQPNSEVSSVGIAYEPIELEWDIHTDFMKREFERYS